MFNHLEQIWNRQNNICFKPMDNTIYYKVDSFISQLHSLISYTIKYCSAMVKDVVFYYSEN